MKKYIYIIVHDQYNIGFIFNKTILYIKELYQYNYKIGTY